MKHLHRVAIVTLHNPTRHVRAVLDRAFLDYTHAYTEILRYFAPYTLEELTAMATDIDKGQPRRNWKHFVKNLFGRDAPEIKAVLAPLESQVRESLLRHVAETLLSYIALAEDPRFTASYPERLRREDTEPIRLETLKQIATLADNLDEEQALFARLQKTRQVESVPISFCRIDATRNCGLFFNPDNQRFYARLFVIAKGSRYSQPITTVGRYIDIRTGKVYMRDEDARKTEGIESFGTGKASILVPLETGKWHEQVLRYTDQAFLPQCLNEGTPAARPVAAKLVKRGDNYQLHVAFQFPKPERIPTETLLGVDRGINCLAAGAVISKDGLDVLETFRADGTELRTLQKQIEQNIRTRQEKGKVTKGDKRRSRIAENHVHICANQIVKRALKHKAQVVMEALEPFTHTEHTKGKRRSNFRAMLPRRQYENLLKAVDEKLAFVGLPPVCTVSPAYTSQTCTACGHISAKNRSAEDRTQFVCAMCGHTAHADEQAGVNIARRLLWLQLRGQEAKADIPPEKRTSWAAFAKTFARAIASNFWNWLYR